MKKTKSPFQPPRSLETKYSRLLSKIANEIGRITDISSIENVDKTVKTLGKYAELIHGWAEIKAAEIISEISRVDKRAWLSLELSRGIKQVILTGNVSDVIKRAEQEQIALITSLPKEAAERVVKLAQGAVTSGMRASEIVKEISRTGEVTKARARTIARTEISRTSTMVTQGRAEAIGSEGYIWRTSRDSDVRESHKKMEGKFVDWRYPPTLDGMTGHAGEFPNCRCYTEVVIPEDLK